VIYEFFYDPGHGWLQVTIEELKTLGIADQISEYSYQHDGNAYLEEDCDMATFIKAKVKIGEGVEFVSIYHAATPIREYQTYKESANA
jgi:hypothetical protein